MLEVPGWMFDRASCAVMRLSEHPYVSAKQLYALTTLLKYAAGTTGEGVIESQHLGSLEKGDADEEREKVQQPATQPVSDAGGYANLADPAPRSARESLVASGSVASRGSLSSPPLSGKGGVR
jgi:hypothetical protein